MFKEYITCDCSKNSDRSPSKSLETAFCEPLIIIIFVHNVYQYLHVALRGGCVFISLWMTCAMCYGFRSVMSILAMNSWVDFWM